MKKFNDSSGLGVVLYLCFAFATSAIYAADDPAFEIGNDGSIQGYDADPNLIDAVKELLSEPETRVGQYGTLVTEKMSPEQKVKQTYRRCFDVHRREMIESVVSEIAPAKSGALTRLFEKRIQKRELEDDASLVVKVLKNDSKGQTSDALSTLVDNEFRRMTEFSADLKRILDATERSELSFYLVKKLNLDSLSFPFVAEEFGIDPSDVRRIADSLYQMQKNGYDVRLGKSTARQLAKQNAPIYVGCIRLMELDEIERFFQLTGQLNDGQEIEDLASSFSLEYRPMLSSMIKKKIADRDNGKS